MRVNYGCKVKVSIGRRGYIYSRPLPTIVFTCDKGHKRNNYEDPCPFCEVVA